MRAVHQTARLLLAAALVLAALPFTIAAQDSIGTTVTASPVAPAFVPLALPAPRAIPAKAAGFCGQETARLGTLAEVVAFDTVTARRRTAVLAAVRGTRVLRAWLLVTDHGMPDVAGNVGERWFCAGMLRRIVPRDTTQDAVYDWHPVNLTTGQPLKNPTWRASEWALTDPRLVVRLLDLLARTPLPAVAPVTAP